MKYTYTSFLILISIKDLGLDNHLIAAGLQTEEHKIIVIILIII